MRHFMRLRAGSAILVFAAALLLAIPASAQLQFSLIPVTQNGQEGQTLTFGATLTNIGAVELFLNSDDFTLSDPDLELDDTKFFDNLPLSLAPGQAVTADLFDVLIGPTVQRGVYSGRFTVIGGTTDTSALALASQSFQVTVAAPEPAVWALISVGLMTAGLLRRRDKRGDDRNERGDDQEGSGLPGE